MHRRVFAGIAVLVAAAALGLSACGGSSSTPSSSAAGTSSSAGTVPANSGSSFCTQAASIVAQFAHIGSTFQGTTPGATPNVNAFKQLIATVASAIDSLDSSAPGEIASAFHVLRSAYDQASSQVQSATSLAQVGSALTPLDAAAVKSSATTVKTYLQNSCGITTPSP
jgi:hypothetical protein